MQRRARRRGARAGLRAGRLARHLPGGVVARPKAGPDRGHGVHVRRVPIRVGPSGPAGQPAHGVVAEALAVLCGG